MVDDTLLCTIEGGMEVPVLVDNTLDLDDVSNFCPLLDWRSIEGIVGTDDGVANLAEVPKQSRYTETEIQTALEYAAKSKEFPPNIEKDSDFHIEFLFRHFCRLAKPSRVKKCDKKSDTLSQIKKAKWLQQEVMEPLGPLGPNSGPDMLIWAPYGPKKGQT